MNAIRNVLCCGIAVALGGCVTAVDLVSTFAAASISPSSLSAHQYAETDEFDQRLASSFVGKQEEVRIEFGDEQPVIGAVLPATYSPAALQEQVRAHRLARWNSIIMLNGGVVLQCPAVAEESVFGFAKEAFEFLWRARNASLYLLARDYNSLIYLSGEEPGKVDHVVFTREDQPTC